MTNDENIGNHGYIEYIEYIEYIGDISSIFWKKILVGLKLLKTHGNTRKTS